MAESDSFNSYFPVKNETSRDAFVAHGDPLIDNNIKKEVDIKLEEENGSAPDKKEEYYNEELLSNESSNDGSVVDENIKKETGVKLEEKDGSSQDKKEESYNAGIVSDKTRKKKVCVSTRKRKKLPRQCTQSKKIKDVGKKLKSKKISSKNLYPNDKKVKDAVVKGLLTGRHGTLECVQYKDVTLRRKGKEKGYWLDGKDLDRFKREENGKSMYFCEDCLYRVEYKNSFKVHFITHANLFFVMDTINKTLNKFYCYICDAKCKSALSLERHVETHKHPEIKDERKDVVLPVRALSREMSRSSDEWSDGGEQVFHDDASNDGDKEYVKEVFSYDVKLEDQNAPYSVQNNDECKSEEVYITEGQINISIMDDSTVKETSDVTKTEIKGMLKCEFCNFETEQADELLRHDCANEHGCDMCGKVLTSKRALREHKKLHACYKCDFKSSSTEEVLEHRKDSIGCWYNCSNCTYKTLFIKTFQKHRLSKKCKIKEESGNPETSEMFSCDVCQYKTKYKDVLDKHVRLHDNQIEDTDGKGNKCKFCDHVFISSSRAELIIHAKNSPKCCYTCPKCDFQCFHMNTLRIHVKGECVKPPKPKPKKEVLSCNFCEFTSTNKTDLTFHIRKHTKPFQCDICDFRCSVKISLKIHKKKHIENSYSCTLCDFQCNHLIMFNNHKKSHGLETTTPMTQDPSMRDPRFLYCDRCDFRSKHKYYFKAHMLKHDNILPYLCSVCGASFSFVTFLHAHKKTHEDKQLSKEYKCSHCDFTGKSKASIYSHEKRHTLGNEKQFKCSFCDYRSNQKRTVSIHERKHTGDKPYTCNVCPYSTSYSGNLWAHKKKHFAD